MWRCPNLHCYWKKIFTTLNSLCTTMVVFDPKFALLGIILEDLLPDKMHIMWIKSLYLARKLILQKWISPTSPTHNQWRQTLKYTSRREEVTYKHRECPRKFQKIWSWWLDSNDSSYSPHFGTQRKPDNINHWVNEAWVAFGEGQAKWVIGHSCNGNFT